MKISNRWLNKMAEISSILRSWFRGKVSGKGEVGCPPGTAGHVPKGKGKDAWILPELGVDRFPKRSDSLSMNDSALVDSLFKASV
mgnify:CR=1 FL=1